MSPRFCEHLDDGYCCDFSPFVPPPPLATVPVVIVPEGTSARLLRVVPRGNLLGRHDAPLCPPPPCVFLVS